MQVNQLNSNLINSDLFQNNLNRQTMSSKEQRRSLSVLNDTLKADVSTLKNKHLQMLSHIDTLIRRQKQLHRLRQQLQQQLQKARSVAVKESVVKQEKCKVIKAHIGQLLVELQTNQVTLSNLEEEYKVCLRDYDLTLADVTEVIQSTRAVQLQLLQEKDKNQTIHAMTFDYERLQRVLEEEKKYFKQLSSTEAKSHAQRMQELQKIRTNLKSEELETVAKNNLDQYKIGFIKLLESVKKKNLKNASFFFRGHLKYQRVTQLGISKLKNCFLISQRKYSLQLRKGFSSWRRNAFPSHVMNNIVQNALQLNFQSRTKIKALNGIIQRLNSDKLSVLHLYERTKMITVAFKSTSHKDKHLAFNLWRESAKNMTIKAHFLQKIATKVGPNICRRISFNTWRESTHLETRLEIACHLLAKYEDTKQMARGLRAWRLQVHNRQIQVVKRYVENMKTRSLIFSRVSYENRKVKAITTLQLSMCKIKLRNYFIRYYKNVKQLKMTDIQAANLQTRDQLSSARAANKLLNKELTKKRLGEAIRLFQKIKKRREINPAFKVWKNNAYRLTERNRIMVAIVLRKEAKDKLHVMNEFRKNIQNLEKKALHQILTDLNNKMERINEKSTQFREALRKIIQSLGVQSSKKVNEVFEYTMICQKKVYFNWNTRISIRNKFKNFLLSNLLNRLTLYGYNTALKQIQYYGRDKVKDTILAKREELYLKKRQDTSVRKAFDGILKQLKTHKVAFAKLIHVQNVLYFYRIECAMVALRKKAHIQAVKEEQNEVKQLSAHLKDKKQNLKGLQTDRSTLNTKLHELFKKFLCYQQKSMNNQYHNHLENQKKRYFRMYRANVRRKEYQKQVLTNFANFFEYKNYFIFWKSILLNKFQKQQETIKEELGNINKKKKTFDQKAVKAKTELERRLGEQSSEHAKIEANCHYYTQKYGQILSYYDRNHEKREKQMYLKSIFSVWRRQCLGAKKAALALSNILRRKSLIAPYRILFAEFKKHDLQYRSQLKCFNLLDAKGKQLLRDGMNYWRYNMRHGYCEGIRHKINNIDDYHQEIKEGVFSKADMLGNEIIRNRYFNHKKTVFMALKNQLTNNKNQAKKLRPLQDRIGERRIFEAMRNWKWLLHYKRTKRSFLDHKARQNSRDLKRDVFNSLKIYREEIIQFEHNIDNFVVNRKFDLLRYAFSKVINVAAHQRDELNLTRKRHLHSVLMGKVSRQEVIKRKLMWKWQSWLIPRTHYLPKVLKSIEIRLLRSAFANINEKKYWHQIYIKDIAERVTTEGYSDVNSVTNILVREGFDPDELKDYLRIKNEKDTRMITQVVSHIKAWPEKEQMVRAFNSWKEFVEVKKNIRRTLGRVFNFSQGLGRYFNKWRKKDPVFNELLQRESRVNMLERYKDLERLMKEYKRDIKDSLQNCEELKEINDEHAQSTQITVQMAFSNVSHSVHKGMKQGLQLWRAKVKRMKADEMNYRYDELVDGISVLDRQKRDLRERIVRIQMGNAELKQKCKWGRECGQLLKGLVTEKDVLAIDLAEKQHNMKILLEDNLRLKQKIKVAKESASNLLQRVHQQENRPGN